eukprot:COSAG02_NODE_834_length_16653_cov_9.111977_2_plen_48_part_00
MSANPETKLPQRAADRLAVGVARRGTDPPEVLRLRECSPEIVDERLE